MNNKYILKSRFRGYDISPIRDSQTYSSGQPNSGEKIELATPSASSDEAGVGLTAAHKTVAINNSRIVDIEGF